jgi:hypothetical protein
MPGSGAEERSYGSTRGERYAANRKARNRSAAKVARKARKRARA